jgi:uncharacterized protein (TIGR00255 family)
MHSMTGFGKAEGDCLGTWTTVEIKTVNHRFLETRFRTPHFLASHDTTFAAWIRGFLQRGSVDCSIRLLPSESQNMQKVAFTVQKESAESLWDAVQTLAQVAGHKTKPPLETWLSAALQSSKVLQVVEESPEAASFLEALKPIFEGALQACAQFRQKEGARLKKALEEDFNKLQVLTTEAEKEAANVPSLIHQKLTEKLSRWNLKSPVDPERLEWEVTYFASRAEVSEECVRLGSHLKEAFSLLESRDPVGRKLDFLIQEIGREWNTLGAKTQGFACAKLALEAKLHLEKLREQVQNVE